LNIHLLCCSCENEHIAAHDTFLDTSAVIALENATHVQREDYYLFPHHAQRQVDIVIIRNSFGTMANVFIIHLIHIDLVQCASTTTTHATTIVIQNKA
jgi:hypothetical protein